MGLYDYISGIAVLVYVFMLLIMANSQKTKMRDIFLGVIVVSIMWAGGSWLMRKQALPNYQFWYHVSLLGILIMPVMYFRFIMEYIQNVKKIYPIIYGAVLMLIFVLNITEGLFVPPPSIQQVNGVEVFVYDQVGPLAILMYIWMAVAVTHMLAHFYMGVFRNPKLKRMSRPITIGIMVIFIGNVLIMFEPFKSFPVDILAGIINAFALVYALARKSPFRLRMLMSESVGYAICLFLSFMSLFVLNPMIKNTLLSITTSDTYWTTWYLGIFSILLILYYSLWKMVVIGVFVKDEDEKSERMNSFSSNITRSLDSDYIFRETFSVIDQVVGHHKIYLALKTTNNNYKLTKSNQPLADLSIKFRNDNPLIKRLVTRSIISISEFKYDTAYQTMWEKEKYDLINLDITHAFGLTDDEGVHGVLLISDTHSKKRITHQQELKLQTICTMVSIALKNSASYEKAIEDARTDDLTGLYNRKYFYQLIEDQFDEFKEETMALVLVNLDDFKLYNQLYGVQKADQALETIATIIKGSVGEDGYVARYSGKEYTMILPMYDVFKTRQLIEKINEQIATYAKGKSKILEKPITASVGICVYPFGAANVNELIENVQQAVYQVKRNGKNNIRVFDTYVQSQSEEDKKSYSSIYNEYKSTIYALTAAIDAKDSYTFSHSDNVALYAEAFAKELNLNNDIVENVRQAGLLHDIGKISIPEQILNKPGRLTEEEFDVMKGHVDASIDIIRHLPSLEYVIPGVLGHHERYDGTGYPRRIKGEDIPLTARILCIVDAFDAMISGRVYKTPKAVERALDIILEEAGKQFDPNLAITFVDLVKRGKIEVDLANVIAPVSEETEKATRVN